jgi:hypothetical protein
MLYLFLALKIPLLGACWIVWWAIRAKPEEEDEQSRGDGGQRTRPHPPRPLPRSPRRGPHGDPAPLPPPRVRPLNARATRRLPR